MHDGYLSNVAIIKSPSNMLASCECVHAEVTRQLTLFGIGKKMQP